MLSSQVVMRVNKSRRVKWVRHVPTHGRDRKCTHNFSRRTGRLFGTYIYVGRRAILKLFLKKQRVWICAISDCFTIEPSGEIL
jgi:hypothetical protein